MYKLVPLLQLRQEMEDLGVRNAKLQDQHQALQDGVKTQKQAEQRRQEETGTRLSYISPAMATEPDRSIA